METNKEILKEVRTDMKWVKSEFKDLKKISVEAKDRSLKNEQSISSLKYFATVLVTLITITAQGLSWLYKKFGG